MKIYSDDSVRASGYLIIKCEHVSENNDIALLQIGVENIEDISGFFSAFEPFFYVCKLFENNEKHKVYMSEYKGGRNVV